MMFIIFKFKRFIPPRIRRAKEVPGCDEKKSYILGKKLFYSSKESQSSKKETEGEQRSHYGNKEELNDSIILLVPVQTTGG